MIKENSFDFRGSSASEYPCFCLKRSMQKDFQLEKHSTFKSMTYSTCLTRWSALSYDGSLQLKALVHRSTRNLDFFHYLLTYMKANRLKKSDQIRASEWRQETEDWSGRGPDRIQTGRLRLPSRIPGHFLARWDRTYSCCKKTRERWQDHAAEP